MKYKCSACINVNSCILKTEIKFNRGDPDTCPFGFKHVDWKIYKDSYPLMHEDLYPK